jgi:hypothetical protein
VSQAKLPVDPARLRREFPALTEQDVDAYVQITRRILGAAPDARPRLTRETLEGARRAREKAGRAETLDPGETLLVRYLEAVEKMQRKAPSSSG